MLDGDEFERTAGIRYRRPKNDRIAMMITTAPMIQTILFMVTSFSPHKTGKHGEGSGPDAAEARCGGQQL